MESRRKPTRHLLKNRALVDKQTRAIFGICVFGLWILGIMILALVALDTFQYLFHHRVIL